MESARASAWPEVDADWVGVGRGAGGHQTEGASFKIVTFTETKKEEFDMKGNDQAVRLVVWSSS